MTELPHSSARGLIIAQCSDNHLGITKPSTYRNMLEELQKEDFDLFVHCGDYCGGVTGHQAVSLSVQIFREIFPDKPYLTVLGNRDFWCDEDEQTKSKVSLSSFVANVKTIKNCLKNNQVHFLDDDGPFEMGGWVFIGSSGWYNHPNPATNDQHFLPIGLFGDTNAFLLKRSNDRVDSHLEWLKEGGKSHPNLVFVSHFPVINTGDDYKRSFEDFSWSESLGEHLAQDYGIKHFLNGHAHQLHHGPLRYESGSDYYAPRYQIIKLPMISKENK